MIPFLNGQVSPLIMGYRWRSLPLNGASSEELSALVNSVAISQIEELGNQVSSEPKQKMPLFLELLTEVGFLEFILNEFLSPQESFKTLESLCGLNSNMRHILNVESSWSSFYKRLQKKYPTVRNLDELGAGPLLGITATSVEPIQSTKKSIRDLAAAGLMAKLSEDGGATIVTIPADWSIEKLEDLSKKAVEEMNIPSAKIRYGDQCKKTLQQYPNKEAQTIILTNTVIGDRSAASGFDALSRGKTVAEQKAHLENHGIKEFPDALTTLTAIVLTRILTQGQSSLYSRSNKQDTWTRVKPKAFDDRHLCLSSSLYRVRVSTSHIFGSRFMGVGASGSSKDIGTWNIGA